MIPFIGKAFKSVVKTTIAISTLLFLDVCEARREVSLMLASPEVTFGKVVLREDNRETKFDLQLTGLEPNTIFTVKLYGGTCSSTGASSTVLCNVTTDQLGQAKESGTIKYRGRDPIAMEQLNDDHALVLESDERSICATLRIK